jgi:hypothetical protein
MADEIEFGAATTEINEDEMGEGLHVVDDEAIVDDEPIVDDVDDETPVEEEEEEDPFKIGLEEILDPNGDNSWGDMDR